MKHSEQTWRDYVERLTIDQKEYMFDLLLNVLLNEKDSIIYYSPNIPAEYPDEPDIQEGIRWSSSGGLILSKYEEEKKEHQQLCEEFEKLRIEGIELKIHEIETVYPT